MLAALRKGRVALVLEDEKKIRIFDTRRGEPGEKLIGHEAKIVRLAASPDGRKLATARVCEIEVLTIVGLVMNARKLLKVRIGEHTFGEPEQPFTPAPS